MLAIPEDELRRELPPMPEWFPDALARLASHGEKPLFRVVNGSRETHYRRGKQVIKHILQDENTPVAVNISKTRYRRVRADGTAELYRTYLAAQQDKDETLLPDIETATVVRREIVGTPAWIIEVYRKPEEICPQSWAASRYDYLEKNGIEQLIDLLGPYPTGGDYIYCFPVINDEGDAVAPSERTLDECRRRLYIVSHDTQTVEHAIEGSNKAMEAFEAKQKQLLNSNFYAWAGPTAKTATGEATMSKPIKYQLASAARK